VCLRIYSIVPAVVLTSLVFAFVWVRSESVLGTREKKPASTSTASVRTSVEEGGAEPSKALG